MYTIPVPTNKINQQTRESIGEALYLLMHLIDRCNWEKGSLVTSNEAISATTGIPATTIKRWMQMLVNAGEITARRVRNGTLITLANYEAIANTRFGKKAGRKQTTSSPNKSSVQTTDGLNNRPEMAAKETKTGLNKGPEMDHHETMNGLNNININISKIREQNFVQSKTPLSSCDSNKQNKRELFDYSDPWTARLAEVDAKLAAMDEAEREAITNQALSSMARDRKPFVRHFVKMGVNGSLEPSSATGEEMVRRKIWEMMEGV